MKVIDLSKIKENEPLTSDVKAWIGLRVRVRRGLASGCGNDPHRTRPHKYATWLALQQVQEQGFDPKVLYAQAATQHDQRFPDYPAPPYRLVDPDGPAPKIEDWENDPDPLAALSQEPPPQSPESAPQT